MSAEDRAKRRLVKPTPGVRPACAAPRIRGAALVEDRRVVPAAATARRTEEALTRISGHFAFFCTHTGARMHEVACTRTHPSTPPALQGGRGRLLGTVGASERARV
ncbi:hypothetical protein KM043_014974 [Ampulex compressa]|nr:hypothetical protein KM043_014974 [Ampulex compressa]